MTELRVRPRFSDYLLLAILAGFAIGGAAFSCLALYYSPKHFSENFVSATFRLALMLLMFGGSAVMSAYYIFRYALVPIRLRTLRLKENGRLCAVYRNGLYQTFEWPADAVECAIAGRSFGIRFRQRRRHLSFSTENVSDAAGVYEWCRRNAPELESYFERAVADPKRTFHWVRPNPLRKPGACWH